MDNYEIIEIASSDIIYLIFLPCLIVHEPVFRISLKFYYQCVMDLNALPGQIAKEITVSSFIHIMK